VKGWCPVHDRVFEAPDGDCPECGTALVAIDEEERDPTIVPVVGPVQEPVIENSDPATSDEPSRWAWVTQPATLGAFLIGLDAGAPNGSDGPHSQPAIMSSPARSDVALGRVSRGADIGLRLESFSQRGNRIVMRVAVSPNEPIPIGSLQTAQVEFFGEGGRSTGVMTSLPIRVTTTGFIVDGVVLERADIPVVAAQIDSLTFSVPAETLMPLNLSGVWPPDPNGGPRIKQLSTSVKVGQRTFILRSLVSWLDRIEARVQIRGTKEHWDFDDEFSLVIGNIERRSGQPIQTTENQPNILHVVFDAPRRLGEKPGIIIDHNHLEISGFWRWSWGCRRRPPC
jgi:hypothetical protein